MPKALKDLLHASSPGTLRFTEWLDDKSTNAGVTKGGVNVNTGRGKPGGTAVNVGHGSVGVHTENPPPHQCRRWQRRRTVGTGTKGQTRYVRVKPGPNPFNYLYAATETQLHENPNVALFFLPKDLRRQKNELAIHQNHKRGHIFAPPVVDSIPFSSNKLPEILDTFSLKPTSDEAEAMKKTIKECEEKGIKGEEKLCATSLESMVDFSTSMLGKDVKALSTNAENGEKKEYTIVGVTKMSSKKALVVCHRQEYAYAVFYCHKTDATVAYEVMMAAADGAAAVAVCHRDTAAWNPKHLAFQVLKVKPGAVPVCHFLPEDHIVWVPKY
ncbi:hypothetical protein DH2020_025310 [Rehmannia glutinosa]|uniref:BURP domain-containing protein n=1 Tax=Rehmannia glutinosa TaxID=99300 RepID=A0ABR0W101_REHGL